MLMPGRKYSAQSGYRYGFNGKENDNEVKGEGNQQDYGMRVYDPRLGKFLSVDPIAKKFPFYTVYQYAGNKPIWCIDIDGLEDIPATGSISPQPYNQEQLVNWAKNDVFTKAPISRNETVILIQNYFVIPKDDLNNPNPNAIKWKLIEREIMLYKGAFGKPISIVTQDDAVFTESGFSHGSKGPTMSSEKLTFNNNPELYLKKYFEINKGSEVNLDILFNTNSLTLQDESESIEMLRPLAYILNSDSKTFVTISGNTNLDLNLNDINEVDGKSMKIEDFLKQRADKIKKLLVEKLNVDASKIKTSPGRTGDKEKSASATASLEKDG